MIYDKKLICFALAFAYTVSATTTVASLMKRQIAISTDCIAERAKCLIEAGCEDCWSKIEDTTVPTSTDCADYVSWFKSFPVAQSCDYTTAGSALSDLAYCYFDSVTKNDNNLDCVVTFDDCADQQSACDSDADCTHCYDGKSSVTEPASNATCADYQAYYVDTVKSFPMSCNVTSPIVEDLVFCRYDSMTLASGVEDNGVKCPAVPGTGSDVCGTTAVNGTMDFDGSYELCPSSIAGVNLWVPGADSTLNSSILSVNFDEYFGFLTSTSSSASNVSSTSSSFWGGGGDGHRHLVERVLKGLPHVGGSNPFFGGFGTGTHNKPSQTSSASSTSSSSSSSQTTSPSSTVSSSSSSWTTTDSSTGSGSSSYYTSSSTGSSWTSTTGSTSTSTTSTSPIVVSCLWIISSVDSQCPVMSTSSSSASGWGGSTNGTDSGAPLNWSSTSSNSSSYSSSSSSWYSWYSSYSTPFSSLLSELFSSSLFSSWTTSTSVTDSQSALSSGPFYYNLDCAASPEEITSEWYYYDDTGRNAVGDISLSCLDQ